MLFRDDEDTASNGALRNDANKPGQPQQVNADFAHEGHTNGNSRTKSNQDGVLQDPISQITLSQTGVTHDRGSGGHGVKPIKCPLCNHSADDPTILGLHLISIHGGKSPENVKALLRQQLAADSPVEAAEEKIRGVTQQLDDTQVRQQGIWAKDGLDTRRRTETMRPCFLNGPARHAGTEMAKEYDAQELSKLTHASNEAEKTAIIEQEEVVRLPDEVKLGLQLGVAGHKRAREQANFDARRRAYLEEQREIDRENRATEEARMAKETEAFLKKLRAAQKNLPDERAERLESVEEGRTAGEMRSAELDRGKEEKIASTPGEEATGEELLDNKQQKPEQICSQEEVAVWRRAGESPRLRPSQELAPETRRREPYSDRSLGGSTFRFPSRTRHENDTNLAAEGANVTRSNSEAIDITLESKPEVATSLVEVKAERLETAQLKAAQAVESTPGKARTKPNKLEVDCAVILAKIASICAEREEAALRAASIAASADNTATPGGLVRPVGPTPGDDDNVDDGASDTSDLITF